jgi:hypothetical protein
MDLIQLQPSQQKIRRKLLGFRYLKKVGLSKVKYGRKPKLAASIFLAFF